MHFAHLKLAVLLPFLFLGACASVVPHVYLPDAARDKIASTDVVAPIRQSEIYVFVPAAQGGAGFGLLGALVDISIDAKRTKKAEAAVKPLRDSLIDFDFDTAMRDDLKSSLNSLEWMHTGDPRVIKEVTPDNLDRVLTASKADAVLFVVADYQLSNDADTLTVTIAANLFPNSVVLHQLQKGKSGKLPISPENALYRNTLVFKAKIPGATDDRDHNIAALSDDKGAATRAILLAGATKLAALLADDIQRREGDAADVGQVVRMEGANGHVIAADADGELVRFESGTLEYITKSAL